MNKSMNILKAAMAVIVLGLAGLFASCSSGSSNDPIVPSETTAKATSAEMVADYYIGDSLLDYTDIKIVYTDADGKQQTVPVEQSKCKKQQGKNEPYYVYELKVKTTKFPTTLTAKMEVTPKEDSVLENAKTSPCIYLSNSYTVNFYDKDGKTISTKELIASSTRDQDARLDDNAKKMMKEVLKQMLNEQLTFFKLDKTVNVSITADNASYELK